VRMSVQLDAWGRTRSGRSETVPGRGGALISTGLSVDVEYIQPLSDPPARQPVLGTLLKRMDGHVRAVLMSRSRGDDRVAVRRHAEMMGDYQCADSGIPSSFHIS
jgi:hypothetical protein